MYRVFFYGTFLTTSCGLNFDDTDLRFFANCRRSRGFFVWYATHGHLLFTFCLKWTFENGQILRKMHTSTIFLLTTRLCCLAISIQMKLLTCSLFCCLADIGSFCLICDTWWSDQCGCDVLGVGIPPVHRPLVMNWRSLICWKWKKKPILRGCHQG